MGKRIGGLRRKTRKLMRKHVRTKGKVSIGKYFQPFKEGENVLLIAEPAVQKGMFNLRFWGRTGVVHAKRGHCYEVEINDQGKRKMFIVHPIHLRKKAIEGGN